MAGTFAHHGGPSRSVPTLCDTLAMHADVALVTASPTALRESLRLPSRARSIVVTEPAPFGRLRGARRFEGAVVSTARETHASIIHDHGIWLPSNHASARAAAKLGVPRVVSPRGMLSQWALDHRGWKKRLAWRLYQRADLESASAFHATAEKEAVEIRALGFTQPIAVIPNGIEIPAAPLSPSPSPARGRGGTKVALFMSRLHPKKGVLDLILAWGRVRPRNWELWLAGPDEGGYRVTLEKEIARLGLAEEIRFLGEVGDAEKARLFARADLFVLPSHDENFGLVVGEALAAGVPVVTTTATPWTDLERIGAGWIVPPGVDGAIKALRTACALERDQLAQMGKRARQWAESSLTWPSVALRMKVFYEWLLDRQQDRPEWVRT